MSNTVFRTDKESILLSDLDLPHSFIGTLRKHFPFFNNKRLVKKRDHAITARQKDVLRIFGIGEEDMKEKLGKEAETLWISSAANGKENKKNGETG